MNTKFPKVIEAAQAAGEIISQLFGESLEVEQKSMAADFRTKADMDAEAKILEILEQEYPDYGIFSEESGYSGEKSEFQFVIDPLDGTNNFSLGIPNFAVSIALQQNERTIFGVVYQPILKQTCWAELGQGAWNNSKKISVNSEDKLPKSTLFSCVGYDNNLKERQILRYNLSGPKAQGLKRWAENWAVAMDCCLVADGRAEIMVMKGLELHDFAAGKLIAKEAGARSTDLSGEKDDDQSTAFILSNGTSIHEQVLSAIKLTHYDR